MLRCTESRLLTSPCAWSATSTARRLAEATLAHRGRRCSRGRRTSQWLTGKNRFGIGRCGWMIGVQLRFGVTDIRAHAGIALVDVRVDVGLASGAELTGKNGFGSGAAAGMIGVW